MHFKNIIYGVLCLSLAFCYKNTPQAQPPDPPKNDLFAKGADVSWLTEMKAAEIKFYNSSGFEKDCMQLLKDIGMNTIRLRVWVNPSGIWNGTSDVVAKAIRARNSGMKVMIDFHYSDTWADPGHQTKPAAWASLDFNSLKVALADHTTSVLNTLKSSGVTPAFVQVGNETNDGLLWPDGKASTNMKNFAQLINAGYTAVKAVDPSIKVIVHISNGWDNSLFRWIFDGLRNNGAQWDIIGMSLYPDASNWSTINTQCLTNMNDMAARYNKNVMVVETGISWDKADACRDFLKDLMAKVKSISNNSGRGVLYWEPEAYANWKGYTLGAFDNDGKPTVALDAFK